MKIRFQVVCTAYHKGRLRLVYDPNGMSPTAETNTSHTCIHDIQSLTDFTVSVAMAQPTSFVLRGPAGSSESTYQSTSPLDPIFFGNGVLGVYVETDLVGPTQPGSPTFIPINVYVSFEDDFEVADPCDDFAAYTPFVSQMGEYDPTAVKGYNALNDPAPTASTLLNPPRLNKDHLNEVFYGERITSFRQMIKRYTMWRCFQTISASAGGVSNFTVHAYAFPIMRGAMPSGLDNNGTYSYVNNNLIHWITLCHQGWRGSIRYKIVPVQGVRDANAATAISVRRTHMQDSYYEQSRARTPSTSQRFTARIGTYNVLDPPWDVPVGDIFGDSQIAGPGGSGMALSGGFDKPLEFEVPYQSNHRFCIGKRLDWIPYKAGLGQQPGYDLTIINRHDDHGMVMSLVAAGEDFQCFFWTGMPLLLYSPTIPIPT